MRPQLIRKVVDTDSGGELGSAQDLFSGENYVMNSNFDIFQRQNIFVNPANQAYTADRWQVSYDGSGGSFGITQNGLTPGVIPTSASHYMQVNQTVAASGQTQMGMYYHDEDVYRLGGKTVTLSFYCGTDISRTLSVGFGQIFGSGGSASTLTPTKNFTTAPASGFTLHTLTFEIPSILGKTIGPGHFTYFYFNLPINTTYSFSITSIMLNLGNFAAPHSLMGRNIGGEISLCQRYYSKGYPIDQTPGTALANIFWSFKAYSSNTGLASGVLRFPVDMRTTPSVVLYNSSTGSVLSAVANEITSVGFGRIDGVALGSASQEFVFTYAANAEF